MGLLFGLNLGGWLSGVIMAIDITGSLLLGKDGINQDPWDNPRPGVLTQAHIWGGRRC